MSDGPCSAVRHKGRGFHQRPLRPLTKVNTDDPFRPSDIHYIRWPLSEIRLFLTRYDRGTCIVIHKHLAIRNSLCSMALAVGNSLFYYSESTKMSPFSTRHTYAVTRQTTVILKDKTCPSKLTTNIYVLVFVSRANFVEESK